MGYSMSSKTVSVFLLSIRSGSLKGKSTGVLLKESRERRNNPQSIDPMVRVET